MGACECLLLAELLKGIKDAVGDLETQGDGEDTTIIAHCRALADADIPEEFLLAVIGKLCVLYIRCVQWDRANGQVSVHAEAIEAVLQQLGGTTEV